MNAKAMIAKLLLKLPADWLVKLSGGHPHTLGGRTLDPHLQFIAHGARNQPSLTDMPPDVAQEAARTGFAMFADKAEPGIGIEDFTLPAPGRRIPVRLYKPKDQDPTAPMMVYYHMGGGVIGDVDTCHAFCSILASRLRAPVLSVDYRLAPQHKFPAGLEDCIFAYEWALSHGSDYGAPAGEAAVGGDSMGGNFSAIICNEMKAQGKPQPALQLLIYPALDLVSTFESAETYGDSFPLTSEIMDWFGEQYATRDRDRADPRISPAMNTDLGGLAPAIIITAGFDALLDQGPMYEKRLIEAGVAVDYACYDSLCHGFTAYTAVSPAARAACQEIADKAALQYKARIS